MNGPLAFLVATSNVALFVCAAMVVRYWLRLRHERQRGAGLQEIEALREEVRRLKEEIEPQIVELTERLDFAERLLANVPRTPSIDRPVTTPV